MKQEDLRQRSAWTSLIVTGVLLLALIISGGARSQWPFSYWRMYASVPAKPARHVKWPQLVVQDEDGLSHRVWPKDLFTIDDDGSQQPAGPALIRAAVRAGKRQREYQESLLRRVEGVLGRRVREVQVRELSWNVDFDVHPPFDKNRPAAEEVLATIERPQ